MKDHFIRYLLHNFQLNSFNQKILVICISFYCLSCIPVEGQRMLPSLGTERTQHLRDEEKYVQDELLFLHQTLPLKSQHTPAAL